MDTTLRARLHDLTLEARGLLVTETAELLEGVYGLHRDGHFERPETLPALRDLPEAAETRTRLERLLKDEQTAGLGERDAVAKLTKEVAYTWLNRIAAFKMLEARRLIRQSVSRGAQSNGFLLWLGETGNEDEYARYEAGSLPADALGEGPRDRAYHHYLLHLCGEMAAQIRVLFDPGNLPSRLCPRPRAMSTLLTLVNDEDVAAAWADDETIGWIYRYFNEQEKAQIFARMNKGAKITASEIPAATQLYTPRWIVRALVENSLGRLWLQMHPDSRLRERLDYLVPDVDAPAVPAKPVRQITLLDPACGTMHFGLVAVDLFAEMYREEIKRAGEPGWPDDPSVRETAEIPAAIVEHNLYGIDIDLRAVQLSALTLFLKAKSLNPALTISQSNLACADILMMNEARLEPFLSEMPFPRLTHERIVRGLWEQLRNASPSQMGSLLRLEERATQLLLQEQGLYQRPGQNALPFEELRHLYGSRAVDEILDALKEYLWEQVKLGKDESYFVGEMTKGTRMLGIVLGRYDVVAANPPYMTSRNMSPVMAAFLKREYPASKSDLYAAFIERGSEMLAPGGRLAMVTQQSFMFISSYEALRGRLRKVVATETMIHVGSRAFAEIGGEKVNTTLFVLRAERHAARRDASVGTYLRLVREPDAEAKRRGFERAVAHLRAGASDPAVYHYRQGDFDAIPGSPWVYWITPGLRRLFQTLPKLGEVAQPRQGLATADNFRFLRYWWEVGAERVARDCPDSRIACANGMRWFPHMKGGEFRRWWGNQEYIVNWGEGGRELKAWAGSLYNNSHWSRILKNTEYYFRSGVTFTDLSAGRLSMRFMPQGFVFDHAGNCVFPGVESDIAQMLGLLNAEMAAHLLALLNPTIHFYIGDFHRLPIPAKSSEASRVLVECAMALSRADSAEDETTYEFVAPPAWPDGMVRVAARRVELAAVEREIDEEVYRLYGISTEDRAAIEAELAAPVVEDSADANGSENDIEGEGELETAHASTVETNRNGAAPANYTTAQLGHLARRWVSYAVGIVLGRFQPGVQGALGNGIAPLSPPGETPAPEGCAWQPLPRDPKLEQDLRSLVVPDGIAPLDAGHPYDLASRVARALELLVGVSQVETLLREATGGRPLGEWLASGFFKDHVKLYRKRPIYWLLQSPKRKYGVYVFSERVTADTLHLLRGSRYLGGRIASQQQEIAERRQAIAALPQGGERRKAERALDALETELTDLESFDRALAAVTGLTDSRGQTVGWAPELDDGILINLAPLHTLLPAWSADPKACWQALERGDYDWSHTAMRYWPDRVLAKCRENKSYAIAHGVEVVV